jgi:Tfp pilus assembly protein PilF
VLCGVIWLVKDDGEKALTDLDRRLESDPSSVGALVARAALFMKLGHPAKALLDLDEALKIDPKHENAFRARAAIGSRTR